jgi:hypothetical protein
VVEALAGHGERFARSCDERFAGTDQPGYTGVR